VWNWRKQDGEKEAGVTVRGLFVQEAGGNARCLAVLLHAMRGPRSLDLSMTIANSLSGDGACGKTSLLNVFTRGYNSFPLQSASVLALTKAQILPHGL